MSEQNNFCVKIIFCEFVEEHEIHISNFAPLTFMGNMINLESSGSNSISVYSTSVSDEVMRAPIQLQCIFSYTILANPEVEPHAPNIYQSNLVPSDSINSNKCEGSTSRL